MDILLDSYGDIDLTNNTMRITTLFEEDIRQRILITLGTFKGEWKFNINYGIAYLKNENNPVQLLTKAGANGLASFDLAIKTAILDTTGVIGLVSYMSELDKVTRTVSSSFTVEIETGAIAFENIPLI